MLVIILKDLSNNKFRLVKLWLHIAKILFCLIASLSINGQFRLDNWSTDNGLPQNSVTGLTRTADGYIWLTTNDGLVRFDGIRFKVFNKSNTPELTTNRLMGAFEDKSGRIWFQSEDGGILYYEKGRFNIAMKPNEVPTGRAMFVKLNENSFIVLGSLCNLTFKPLKGNLNKAWQYLKVEEGSYENGVFKSLRILNGDETDWGGPRFDKRTTLLKVELVSR